LDTGSELGFSSNRKEHSMGMRRRSRRRGLIAGAAIGAGVAHHQNKKRNEAYEQGADDQADSEEPQQQAPPAPESDVPTNDIEQLVKLHASGALTDEEFAAAKAKALGI
jgi:hypothetical protein